MADHGQSSILDQTPPEAIRHEIGEGKQVDHSIVEIKETNGEDPLDSGFKKIILEMADHIQIPIHDQTPPTEAIKDGIEEGEKVNLSGSQTTKRSAEKAPQKKLKSTTIFKVNRGLRESNPAAYTPKLISIGPYHNKSLELRSMEKYKLLYLQRFLNRNERIGKKSCMKELDELKDKALMCYDDGQNLGKDIIDKFSEIMLLDGCFLVEFIRERYKILASGENEEDYQPVIDQAWRIDGVLRDMLMLENQLPLFVLTTLYDMTKCPTEERSFFFMMGRALLNVFRKKTRLIELDIDHINAEQFDHLLGVVHMLSGVSESNTSIFYTVMDFLGNFFNRSKEIHIESVTKLQEKGISFKKIGSVEEDDEKTLLDITFAKGSLEIPCFRVDDSTETVLRNLIAYEQHSSNLIPYFSSYAQIMSQLINTDKDVQLLRESEIIVGQLNDSNVANIFCKLSDGVKIDPHKFYYRYECSELIQYCQKPQNKMMAYLRNMMRSLRKSYFFSPWAGASTVGAIMLLILTTIQTILAFRKC